MRLFVYDGSWLSAERWKEEGPCALYIIWTAYSRVPTASTWYLSADRQSVKVNGLISPLSPVASAPAALVAQSDDFQQPSHVVIRARRTVDIDSSAGVACSTCDCPTWPP